MDKVYEGSKESTNREIKHLLIPAVTAFLIFVADQTTKHLVVAYIPLNRGLELIPGYVDLVHTRNPGAAFGIMAGSDSWMRSAFLVVISVIALVVIIWVVVTARDKSPLLLAACGLFFGGALGNLIDRIRVGEVIDFIDVHRGELHWPAFNVADASLCVATALFFLHFLFAKRPS